MTEGLSTSIHPTTGRLAADDTRLNDVVTSAFHKQNYVSQHSLLHSWFLQMVIHLNRIPWDPLKDSFVGMCTRIWVGQNYNKILKVYFSKHCSGNNVDNNNNNNQSPWPVFLKCGPLTKKIQCERNNICTRHLYETISKIKWKCQFYMVTYRHHTLNLGRATQKYDIKDIKIFLLYS